MTDTPDDLLTVGEVGLILRRSEKTVLRLIEKGLLQNKRYEQIHYIKRRWVWEYVDSLPSGIKTRKGKEAQ